MSPNPQELLEIAENWMKAVSYISIFGTDLRKCEKLKYKVITFPYQKV